MGKGGLPGMPPIAVSAFSAGDGRLCRLMGLLTCVNLCADVVAVGMYREEVDWDVLLGFAGPVAAGHVLGAMVSDSVPDDAARVAVGVLLLALALRRRRAAKGRRLPHALLCVLLVLAGVASVLCNMMSPVVELALLSIDAKKGTLIATSRTLSVFTNSAKAVFHVARGNVCRGDASLLALLAFAAALTAPIAKATVARIDQDRFNRATRLFVALGGASMIVKVMRGHSPESDASA